MCFCQLLTVLSVHVFDLENLPCLLKEIMQEAKRLTDAEWCVVAVF